MLIGFKRGQTGIILRLKVLDSSVATGAGKTGLAFNTSGLIISTIADNEASPTTYTVAGSTIETITTLGTFAAPTATKARLKEVDATNHKGVYELQIADARYAVSSAKSLLVSLSGAANAAETDVVIPLRDLDPYDAVRAGLTALPAAVAAASGGLPTFGTGTGQINLTGGRADADVLRWNGTAVATPNTAGVPIVDTRRLIRQGTAQATGNSTTAIKLDSGASATTDFYKNMLVQFLSGTGAPAAAICTAYDGSTKIATLSPAVPTAADNTTVFQIFPAMADVETWRGTAPNALQSGRVDSYLGAVASGVIAAGSFAANALDAVWSTTTRTLSAFAFSVTVGTNNDKTGYGLSAAAIQAIWDALTSALTTAGSIGKLFVDNINATISSRMATYTQPTGFLAATFPTGTVANTTNISAGTITTATNLTNAPPDSSGVTTLLSRIPSGLFTGITSLAQWLGLIAGKQTGNSTARTELRATGGGSGTFDETTDSLEAQQDNSADLRSFGIMNDTSIATLASQTSFTLTAGSADNNGYLNCPVIITKSSNADQKAVGFISAYTGSTKTVTLLEDPAIFTMAVGDLVTILHPEVGVFKRAVDGTTTFEQGQRLQNSAAAGKVSGAGTTTVTIRDLADTKDRIVATTDVDGNRSAVTRVVT